MAQRKLFDSKTLSNLRKYPLYSQDGKGDNAMVSAKIFNPYGRGTWYITEWDGKDTMYGMFSPSNRYNDDNNEYGYVSKSELENTRINVFGTKLPLERDISYRQPTRLGSIKEREMGKPRDYTIASKSGVVIAEVSHKSLNDERSRNAKGFIGG